MRGADTLPEVVSPQLLMEELLLEWAEDVFSPPQVIEEVKFSVQVDVQGADGGPWVCSFDLGDYSVESGTTSQPFIALQGSEAHWNLTAGKWVKDLVAEMEDAGGPEDFIEKIENELDERGIKRVVLTDDMLEALAQHPTVFLCKVTDFEGQDLSMRVGLFTNELSAEPRFTLSMDGETFESIRMRKLDPVKAWKSKRIVLQGDLVHATKLARTLGQAS
ncbi:MAG: hypothetical protein EP343_15945 [Deltaproteobacteria bacterium]|nr:MAG: hypothetical protein EP343_15945 [Deltaproteobacteria bacterium]